MVRNIGLVGTIANIVGVVIGIAIFILPGHLAATAGPAVIVSYLMAALVAGFACSVAAQIGSVFPVSGASFVAVSRTLSPMLGFLVVWMMLMAVTLGIALLALGFADYLAFFVPWTPRIGTALLLILVLGGINMLGVRSTVIAQVLLVTAIVTVLAVYGVVGVVHANRHLLVPFLPNGFVPVLLATIPAFFSFAAFAVVIEVSGDIQQPARTIPLAFAISFVLVTLLYLSVTVATVGNISWHKLDTTPAPVGEVARHLMSPTLAKAIVLVALAGAASPINALLLSYSRDIMVLAKMQAVPSFLGRVSQSRGVPFNAVLCIVIGALLIVPFSGRLAEIATLSTLSILLLQIALGAVVVLLPSKAPDLLKAARFRFGSFSRMFFGTGLIVMSVLFLLVAAWGKPRLFLLAAGLLLLGGAYYKLRKLYLKRCGIDFDQVVLQSNWT